MSYATQYKGHENAYQSKLASGQDGWDAEPEYSAFAVRMDCLLKNHNWSHLGRALELGCGAGNMTQWLEDLGYQSVVGVDISETAIATAQTRLPIQSFVCQDLSQHSLAEPDTSFDAVFDSHLLHCIVGHDRLRVLEEVHRLLKSNGLFFGETMCTPICKELVETFGYQAGSGVCVTPSGIATRYVGKPDDLRNELEAAGFSIVHSSVLDDDSGCCSFQFICRKL